MIFEENKAFEDLGEKLGYVFSYFLFTTVLFFVLMLLKKISGFSSYVYVMIIAALIAFMGFVIKRLLK